MNNGQINDYEYYPELDGNCYGNLEYYTTSPTKTLCVFPFWAITSAPSESILDAFPFIGPLDVKTVVFFPIVEDLLVHLLIIVLVLP